MAQLLIPIIIVGLVIAVISVMALVVRRWVKCAPNEVLVVYGRKRMEQVPDPADPSRTVSVRRGYRLVRGGATFVVPVMEAVRRINLDTFQVPFAVEDTPNVDGVLVSVAALANMKVSSDPTLLGNAVERLLDKNPKEMEKTATDTLSGILRQIVGTLTVEDIIRDREKIAGQVLNAAVTELGKLGFQLDNFVIQKITDQEGYIEALGKKRTAEVKRNATIAEAEATRDADVKAAAANLEGETAKAHSDEEISNAIRQRDETKAKNDAAVQAEQARIAVRAQTAEAEESRKLKVAQVEAEEAEVQARTRLQAEEKKRMDAQLQATVIVTAEREKEAKIITAQADQEAAVMIGEALRIKEAKAGEGRQARLTAEAEGRKAAADALQKEKEAEAAGERAKLLAQATGREAQGKAEGAAKLAVLSAEADGLDKKNRALAELTDGARAIITLELLPGLVTHAGEAGEKIATAMFESVGLGLSKIDEVRIVDLGGTNGSDSASPVARFAGTVPEVVFGFLKRAEALGIDVNGVLEKLGIDAAGLVTLATKKSADAPDEEARF